MIGKTKYGLHDSLGYWVNLLAGAMHAAFDRMAGQLDVTAAQWAVLITLYNKDAKTPGELARFIGIDGAAITRLLDRLETKGLIERQAHDSDRRALSIELTQAARRLTPKLAEISWSENRRFLKRLTEKEGEQFMKLLRKMAQAVDQ